MTLLIALMLLVINQVASLEVGDTKPNVVTHRPYRLTGKVKIGDKEYQFASGGYGWSIPYGDWKIDDSAGDWGVKHHALGLNNDTIPDPQLGRDRDGIEIHASDHWESAGCFVLAPEVFKQVSETIRDMIRDAGQAFLHVWPDIVSITPNASINHAIYVAEHDTDHKEKETRRDEHPKHRHKYAERRHHCLAHRGHYKHFAKR